MGSTCSTTWWFRSSRRRRWAGRRLLPWLASSSRSGASSIRVMGRASVTGGGGAIGGGGGCWAGIDPWGLTTKPFPLRIELSGSWSRGRTIVDTRDWSADLTSDPHGQSPRTVQVATAVDGARYAELWLSTVK